MDLWGWLQHRWGNTVVTQISPECPSHASDITSTKSDDKLTTKSRARVWDMHSNVFCPNLFVPLYIKSGVILGPALLCTNFTLINPWNTSNHSGAYFEKPITLLYFGVVCMSKQHCDSLFKIRATLIGCIPGPLFKSKMMHTAPDLEKYWVWNVQF